MQINKIKYYCDLCRRRIGKSALVKTYGVGKYFWLFETLEGETTIKQIEHFTAQLRWQTNDEFLAQTKFTKWEQVFGYLTDKIKFKKRKNSCFLDSSIMFDSYSKFQILVADLDAIFAALVATKLIL
ncbi:MAG: hypothetical protein AABY53_06290 [Bdellovibrionota bacterium]